jgi:hypothetical protein
MEFRRNFFYNLQNILPENFYQKLKSAPDRELTQLASRKATYKNKILYQVYYLVFDKKFRGGIFSKL